MLSELKFSFRQLRKNPGFTLTAVLTLALGIGATTAIFTLVNGVLLKSLPVKDPSGLWRLGDNEQCCVDGGLPDYNKKPWDWSLFSYEQYREFRDNTPGFENLAAFQAGISSVAVRRPGRHNPAEPLFAEFVSGNSFDTLGLRPAAGRLLRPSDDSRGAAPVVVMSYQTWQEKFSGDGAVLGSSLLINGRPATVVGIAPPGFFGERLSENTTSFWIPLNLVPALEPENTLLDRPEQQWLNLIGRIAPGANLAQIQGRLELELRQFLQSPLAKIDSRERALIPRQYLRLTPGGAGVQTMQESYKDDLSLLMWISSFVLVIVCANLANLMLVKSVGQMREVAVQTALGATPRRLVQRALFESVSLAVFGALVALPIAWGGARLILHLAFNHQPVSIDPTPSLPVIGFAFGVSLLTGMLFGAAPAWVTAHVNPADALRGASRTTGRHTTWAQQFLVVAQAAISVVVVCAAGFLIVSLNQMLHQHLGFNTTHRYIVNIDPQGAGYKPEQMDTFYRRLEESLTAIPGVSRVAYSLYSPLDGNNWGEATYIEGQPTPPPGAENGSSWNRVSPNYFDTVGTKLVQGRSFTDSDTRTTRHVAIVNETFVKKRLHGKYPIGMHFGDWLPGVTGIFEIVGVAEDTQYWGPNETIRPMYFLPAAQWPELPTGAPRADDYAHFVAASHFMTSIQIETHGDLPQLEGEVRRVLSQINDNLMVLQFRSFNEQVRLAFTQQNMITGLACMFGVLALSLAAIGLYGVTAYAVAERRREIGIRMALGADRVRVQQMVLRGAFLKAGVGLLIGIPAAILCGNLMASQLFGVTAHNLGVLSFTVAVLAGATFLAAVLPAMRAGGVQPMEALRIQ